MIGGGIGLAVADAEGEGETSASSASPGGGAGVVVAAALTWATVFGDAGKHGESSIARARACVVACGESPAAAPAGTSDVTISASAVAVAMNRRTSGLL
jgi:hypothetical protein